SSPMINSARTPHSAPGPGFVLGRERLFRVASAGPLPSARPALIQAEYRIFHRQPGPSPWPSSMPCTIAQLSSHVCANHVGFYQHSLPFCFFAAWLLVGEGMVAGVTSAAALQR